MPAEQSEPCWYGDRDRSAQSREGQLARLGGRIRADGGPGCQRRLTGGKPVDDAANQGVASVEHKVGRAVHLHPPEVEDDGVHKQVQRGSASGEERPPPPVVVLHTQCPLG